MAAAVREIAAALPEEPVSFIDQHFTKVAMAVSSLVLFVLQPLTFFFGLSSGFFLHYHFEPNVIVTREEIATVPRATLAIVAATAAILNLTPGGAAGGYVFQSIAPLFSMVIGSSAFLAYRTC
ncbi:MAG: hypothetical protein K1X28_01165 [Parachlamydiales bacterium]|nr:hypothetical protein [Parachlamydiales bacterium]